jgi:pilus assembly protein CpaE
VVIVTAALDPALLLDAMRAGVNEVVTEPLSQENLTAAIARVARQRAGAEAGQSFAFVGAKGGVGTTTVAVNVAASLGGVVAKGERVLLVDLHQGGGDAGVFVGAEARFSVHDALENTHRLDETFLRTLVVPAAPNVDLLAAPENGIGQIESSRIRALIGAATASYKYTVLDVPGSNGAIMDGLDHVSRIVLVANQELATVKGASRMAAALHRRYGREKVEVVLSRSDRQADIGHTDVERAVGAAIGFTFPSDYRAALQALNKGRPIALENHNELSDAFKRFALKLAGVRADRPAFGRTGLLGRLTQVRD